MSSLFRFSWALKYAVIFGVLFFIAVLSAGAGDDAETFRVEVVDLQFEATGKTRLEALARQVKIKAGSEYPSLESFRTALDREVQDLINLRIFSDVKSEVVVAAEGVSPDGSGWQKVRIVIRVVDTWTIFPFIVPSSDGSSTVITMAVVDKNFLGTLTRFRLSGDFGIGTDPITGHPEIPRWSAYLQWSGFSIRQWELSSQLSQSYKTERKFDGASLIQDYSYYETRFVFNTRYEFKKLPYLFLGITPVFSWRYAYEARVQIDDIEYEYGRIGVILALDYNRVDWSGFYRKGWALGLSDSLWGSGDHGSTQFKSLIAARFSGFGIWGKVNPSIRVLGFYSINHEMTGIGEFLRGVPDDGVYGDRAVFLNTGIQIRLWRGKWVEPHLMPFIDLGLAGKLGEPVDGSRDFHTGVGSELILFLPKVPSAQLRGWFGIDLAADGWSRAKWELGAAFRLHY